MSILTAALLIAIWIISTSLIGLPLVAASLDERIRHRELAVLPLGLCFTVLLVSVGYFVGLEVSTLRTGWIAIVLASFPYLFYSKRTVRLTAASASSFVAIAVCWCIMIAPNIRGGNQFAVFQGNHHDTFNYLDSAVTYWKMSKVELLSATTAQADEFPSLSTAQSVYKARPTVAILYAVLGSIFPATFPFAHYSFLVFLVVASIPALGFLFQVCFGGGLALGVLGSMAFVVGFFGQYVVDINAWSHAASIGPLVILSALLFVQLNREGSFSIRGVAVMALALSSSLFLYPESFFFHALGFSVALVSGPLRRKFFSISFLSVFGASLVFTLLLALTNFDGIIGFLIHQSQFVKSTNVEWWRFFDAYLIPTRSSYSHLDFFLRFLPSALGLYWLKLPDTFGLGFQRLADLSVFLWACGIVFIVYRRQKVLFKKDKAFDLQSFLLGLIACTAFLVVKTRYWAAGKGLINLSPYLILIIAASITKYERTWSWVRSNVILVAFMLCQLGFGVSRIYMVTAANPIGHDFPYPSVQMATLKTDYSWDQAEFVGQLGGCTAIYSTIEDPWMNRYLFIYLRARDVPRLRFSPGQGTCVVSLTKDRPQQLAVVKGRQ